MAYHNELVYLYERSGSIENPYTDMVETLTVTYNRVFLKEVPDRFERVKVVKKSDSGLDDVLYSEVDHISSINVEDNYFVDYEEGVVYFHTASNSIQLEFTYKGKGMLLYPATRIYLENESGFNVENTLQKFADDLTANKIEIEGLMDDTRNLDAQVSANEDSRVDAENVRISNEDSRIAKDSERDGKIDNMQLSVNDVISKTKDRVLVFNYPYINDGINSIYARFPFNGTLKSVRGVCSKFGTDVATEIDIEKSSDLETWNTVFNDSFLTFDINENVDNGKNSLLITDVISDDTFRVNVRTLSEEIEGVTIEIRIELY